MRAEGWSLHHQRECMAFLCSDRGHQVTDNRRKYLPILKMLGSDDPAVDVPIATRAMALFTEKEQEEFFAFRVDVGHIFLEFHEELDQAVADLSDDFSNEDPRKWDMGDWATFEVAVTGHKWEEIIRSYAHQQPNIHLVWAEIEQRLDLPAL